MLLTDEIRHFFEDHAPNWDDRMPDDIHDILRNFALPLAAEFAYASTILEIGSGTGAFIPVLRDLAPQAKLVSMDLAYGMLYKSKYNLPDAALTQADVHSLPVQTNCFGLVVCHNSFPHFSQKLDALKEIKRVLCAGGQLMILHNNSREFVNAIHTRAGAPIHHDLLPDGTEMAYLLDEAGFIDYTIEDKDTHYIAIAH